MLLGCLLSFVTLRQALIEVIEAAKTNAAAKEPEAWDCRDPQCLCVFLGSTLPDSPFVETLPMLGSTNSCVYFCVCRWLLVSSVTKFPDNVPQSLWLYRIPRAPQALPKSLEEGLKGTEPKVQKLLLSMIRKARPEGAR